MTEIEQLLSEALLALKQASGMTAWDKAKVCDRLEKLAYDAGCALRELDEKEQDARYEASVGRWGR